VFRKIISFNAVCVLCWSLLKKAKYEEAVRHEGSLHVVTPDWVVDSVRSRGRCEEGLYHPRLLILPKPRSPAPPPTLSALSRPFGSIGRHALWCICF
jgi:PAX-interacting protein 1